MTDYSTSESDNQSVISANSGTGATPEYIDCCEFCGKTPARNVSLLDQSPLHMCKHCAGIFGYQWQGAADANKH